ncbi:MAG: hypothetical protein AAGA59_21790 [Actinomycetota bacterium]
MTESPAIATSAAALDAAFAEGAGAAWVERDVITVEGPDATSYLQGQLSQNVEALADGESTVSLLLQPQGKIDAYLRVTRTGPDSFALDTDPGHGAGTLARLERFKLRVDCELSVATVPMLAVRGPAATDPDVVGVSPAAGALVVPALWPGAVGFDVLGSAATVAGADTAAVATIDGEAVVVGDAADIDRVRIAVGVPAMGSELGASTIPAAAGIVDDAVDFTKGCYVGQELVARIDSRGAKTAARLCRMRIEESAAGDAAPSPEATVEVDGADAGSLTSVAASPDGGWVALAYIKRKVEVPATAVIRTDGGAELAATVDPQR